MNKPRNLETITPFSRAISSEDSGSSSSTSTSPNEFNLEALDFDSPQRVAATRSRGSANSGTANSSNTLELSRPAKLRSQGRLVRMPTQAHAEPIEEIEDHEEDEEESIKATLIKSIPSWLISTVFHLCVLLLLAMVIPSSKGLTPPIEIQLGERADQLDDFLEEMDVHDIVEETINIDPEFEEMSEAASSEPTELLMEEGVKATLDEFAGLGDGLFESYALGDAPAEEMGTGDKSGATNKEPTGQAEFFGAEAYGSRFVFVIDCSGSMASDGRWQMLVEELVQSINVLGPEQEVLVLLYNNFTFPMLNLPPQEAKMVPATEPFKKSLYDWLAIQRPGGGTLPAHAMMVALDLKPDAIFLLSDGMLDDNTAGMLSVNNKERKIVDKMQKTPVHTITLGRRSGGAPLMEFIARNNNGEFRWVK